MIKKQHVKSRNVCKVTFELPAESETDEAYLLSDVNGWQPIAFEKNRAGKWRLVHEFEPGRDYQFRYMLVKEGRREFSNDEDADRTVPNDQGTENAVISC
jgi:hypothetical protein